MQEAHALRLKDKIEERIATGIYAPGKRLEEAALAEQFGVSRTPVREALQQLSATGLVELRGRRGAIVSAPDATRLLEMFDVMAEMEAMCGRLASRRLQMQDEKALMDALDACRAAVDAGDGDLYYHANERFHRALYAGSGNRFLEEQATALYRRLAPFRRMQFRVRNRLRSSCAEHETIVAAILNGESDQASTRLHSHVSIHGERFGDLMATIDRAKAEVC